MVKVHPLKRWLRSHTEFRAWRDSRRVFGVWPTFLLRVAAGKARPNPDRAKEWEKITGITVNDFLFYNGKSRTRK